MRVDLPVCFLFVLVLKLIATYTCYIKYANHSKQVNLVLLHFALCCVSSFVLLSNLSACSAVCSFLTFLFQASALPLLQPLGPSLDKLIFQARTWQVKDVKREVRRWHRLWGRRRQMGVAADGQAPSLKLSLHRTPRLEGAIIHPQAQDG